MRVDAKKNHDNLLEVAGQAISEHGVQIALRDIARRAGVSLGTLLRHFPSREDLLEALLSTKFDELTAHAEQLEADQSPKDALVFWLREFVAVAHFYRGVVNAMMHAIEDEESALHSSCVAMRTSGARLLASAQTAGVARRDIDGTDLLALAGSVAWLGDLPMLASRVEHLFTVIIGAVLVEPTATPRALTRQKRSSS